MRSLLTLIILYIITVISFAGTTGKIKGRVTDKNSEAPLPGANILVLGTNTGTSTDVDGYYNLINLKPGTYTLVFQYIGYAKYTVEEIVVSVDRTTVVNAELTEESITTGEVIVRAEKPPVQKDRTYSASVVNSATIEELPVTSVGEVIELQPGVVNSGGTLHFRGGRGREVAYIIDGIPVTNNYSQGGGNNVSIENAMIEQLEVISGTFNAEYGSAQSGIINIVTKGPSPKFSGSFSSYVGDYLSSQDDIYLGIDDFNPIAERDFQFSFSGPILQEKLGFSVSGRYNKSESLSWYDRRYTSFDGWRIAAYETWYQEFQTDQLSATQAIYIPDSLKTGDGEKGPLAQYESISLNGKLNYFPTPELKFSYQIFASSNTALGSASSSRRYQPDNMGQSNSLSHHHFLTFRHAVSDKFFYNLGFSFQFNDGESYYRKDNKIALYPGDSGIQPISSYADGFSLGTTDGFYSDAEGKNFRQQVIFNGDFNWQIDKYNFLKGGFEYKKHKVNTYSWGYIATQDWVNNQFLLKDDFATDDVSFAEYWSAIVDYWKNWESQFDTVRYRKYTEDEFTLWRDYTIEPSELAFYLQDKVELGEIIFNAGLRFDMFMPNERIPDNYRVESEYLGTSNNLIDAENKIQLSPRLGVSFPISNAGVFHAAYGHFFQMPSFEKMYNEPLYVLTALQLEGMTLGNANLEPEKTVQYELGLQQEIIPGIAVDVTAYYKDIKNLLGVEYLTTTDNVRYLRYINRDYGNSKGITVGFRKSTGFVTGSINYTYSTANGSASNPEEIEVIQASTQIGGEPVEFIDRQIIPLDWDQRHTLNTLVTFSVPNDWSLSLISFFWSGQPYSPTFVERYDILEVEYDNAAEKPFRWSIDLKAKKHFELFGYKMTAFLKIDNLLDQLNEEYVYSSTGTADHNARLPENESLEIERLAQQNHFTLYEIDNRPQWYSSPRRIQLGFEVNF